MLHSFFGFVKSGVLHINREHMQKVISELPDMDIELSLVDRNKKPSRSKRGLFFIYVGIIAEAKGWDRDQTYRIIATQLFRESKVDKDTGEVFEYIEGVTAFSKEELKIKCEQLRVLSPKIFGVSLPEPMTQEQIEL